MNTKAQNHVPLFVDLDDTLIRSDMLAESALAAVHGDMSTLCRLPLWLIRGRAHLKCQLASRGEIDVESLPYRQEVVEFLRGEKARGRRLVLATATDSRLAHAIADHLQLFDDVLASDGQNNLKHKRKLAAIRSYCENHDIDDFGYVGDSKADLPIWQAAQQCYAVAPSAAVKHALRDRNATTFLDQHSRIQSIIRALRPYQWVKNILVYLPVVMAHVTTLANWLNATIAFAAFCLCASAVYILNDLIDVHADRKHSRKKDRPFASGELPLFWGPPLAVVLVTCAFATALVVSPLFASMLFFYLIMTTLYSLWLKQKPLGDVLTLAGLYSLRIFAGAAATSIVISEWLAAFSFFLFTSLAFAKRYVEISTLDQNSDEIAPGRGYRASDLNLVSTLGPASGYLAVLVLALYINSDAMLEVYHRGWPLWLQCPLLMYWISRVWLHATRKQLMHDPILFAFRDRVSLGVGALMIVLWFIASWPSA